MQFKLCYVKRGNFMGVRHMQGVPAHLETLKAKGTRRHPAYCKYHEGEGKSRVCKNSCSPLYNTHCQSAAKCECYYIESNASRK